MSLLASKKKAEFVGDASSFFTVPMISSLSTLLLSSALLSVVGYPAYSPSGMMDVSAR
jgi:hypothetical protein